VGSAAAGCPDRHAWRLESLPVEQGAPCDASRSALPSTFDGRIVGSEFHDFETLRVGFNAGAGRLVLPVSNGAVTGTVEGMQHAGLYLTVFADAGEQLRCVDGVDRSGYVFPVRFDALSLEVSFEFEPHDLSATCADLIR